MVCLARATPSAPSTSTSGSTTWSFTFDDPAAFATTFEIVFPPGVTFPPPPLSACCDLRLPETPLSARDEVQLFSDDGLWLEIAAPKQVPTSDGMHAALVDEAAPATCDAGDHQKERHPILFTFSSEPAALGESRTGEIDGVAVRGLVSRDFFEGEESGPQALIGRGD